MVRSLENLPDAARFRIALRVHAGWSAYNLLALYLHFFVSA